MERIPSNKLLRLEQPNLNSFWRQIPKQIKSRYPTVVSVVRTDEISGSIPILNRQQKLAVSHSGYLLTFDRLPDAELFATGILTERYEIEWAPELFNIIFKKPNRN